MTKYSIKLGVGLLAFISLLLFSATLPSLAEDGKLFPPGEHWTLSLGGSGTTTTTDHAQTAFGFELDLGRTGHLLLPVQAGVRQAIVFATSEGKDNTVLDTAVYSDWTLFTIAKKLDVFAGGNIGLTYGNITPDWQVAPEAGVRFWIFEDSAFFGRIEYPYDITEGRWRESLNYAVGIQLKF